MRMTPPTFMQKIILWLSRFAAVQLFLSFISLPILIGWGLPFSLLTFAGNLIFNFFLMIFLFLCTLIFFSELLHLPNGLLIGALEYLTATWTSLLHIITPGTGYLTFCRPSYGWLALLPGLAMILLLNKKLVSPSRIISALGVLALLTPVVLWMPHHTSTEHAISHQGHTLWLLKEKKQVALIDTGICTAMAQPDSWIEYTLIPQLITTVGDPHIDHLIITDINARVFHALAVLLKKVRIDHIYLPQFQGTLNRAQKRAYAQFAREKKATVTRVYRIAKNPLTITLGTKIIKLSPLENVVVKKQQLSYHKIEMTQEYNYAKKETARTV